MNHKKIAELAHVSTSTVSKALSGNTEISQDLSDKIRRIAIECGYFQEKKKRKREYSKNESLLIAVLVPELLGIHYSETITKVKNVLEAKGANVSIYIYDFDEKKRDDILQHIVITGAVDGVIIFDSGTQLKGYNIPTVCVNYSYKSNCDSITNDHFAVMNDCVKYLKDLGHISIGFVGEQNTFQSYEAFAAAMTKNELTLANNFVYIANARHEAIGAEAAERILVSQKRPTAIIAAYDVIALSLIHELVKGGIKVPDDISVMGVNNISAAAYAQIPLTSVETFSDELNHMAVDMLFDKIFKETDAVRHVTLEHKIIERASTTIKK